MIGYEIVCLSEEVGVAITESVMGNFFNDWIIITLDGMVLTGDYDIIDIDVYD